MSDFRNELRWEKGWKKVGTKGEWSCFGGKITKLKTSKESYKITLKDHPEREFTVPKFALKKRKPEVGKEFSVAMEGNKIITCGVHSEKKKGKKMSMKTTSQSTQEYEFNMKTADKKMLSNVFEKTVENSKMKQTKSGIIYYQGNCPLCGGKFALRFNLRNFPHGHYRCWEDYNNVTKEPGTCPMAQKPMHITTYLMLSEEHGKGWGFSSPEEIISWLLRSRTQGTI